LRYIEFILRTFLYTGSAWKLNPLNFTSWLSLIWSNSLNYQLKRYWFLLKNLSDFKLWCNFTRRLNEYTFLSWRYFHAYVTASKLCISQLILIMVSAFMTQTWNMSMICCHLWIFAFSLKPGLKLLHTHILSIQWRWNKKHSHVFLLKFKLRFLSNENLIVCSSPLFCHDYLEIKGLPLNLNQLNRTEKSTLWNFMIEVALEKTRGWRRERENIVSKNECMFSFLFSFNLKHWFNLTMYYMYMVHRWGLNWAQPYDPSKNTHQCLL